MPDEIIISGKQEFALRDCQDAPLMANEVRGTTLVTLISQGTELGWANGDTFPIRPGYASIFTVNQIGDGVSGISLGERRFAMGPHRSTQTHLVDFTLPVPDGLASDVAVIARLMGVSMTTLMTTKARAGDRVIVSGAGPVGFLAAHQFQLAGYRVTVIDPDPLRRKQIAESGIKDCRADMPFQDTNLLGKVALFVDCSGHEGAVIAGCQMLRRGGEAVLVGVPWQKLTDHSAHEVMRAVFFNLISLRSGWEWELPVKESDFLWEELLEGYNNASHSIMGGFERALDWLAEGKIPVDGLIHHASPSDPSAIYSDIAARRILEPFIVLDWANH